METRYKVLFRSVSSPDGKLSDNYYRSLAHFAKRNPNCFDAGINYSFSKEVEVNAYPQ
jgi:hypothetical protein